MTRSRISILVIALVFLTTQSAMVAAAPEAPSAIITVNATGDDYGSDPTSCALREAIESANTDTAFGGCTAGVLGTDTIALGSAIYYMYGSPGDEVNAYGDFDILSTIVIQGLDIQQTIINGNSIDRLFHVHETGSLSLNNLTIRDGNTLENGGAIFNQHTVILTHVALLHNQATLNGGAYAYQAVSPLAPPLHTGSSQSPLVPAWNLTCTDCYFQYNQANGAGGGIYSDVGSMELINIYMEQNIADENNDGSGDGGAIFTNSDVDIENGEFIENHSKRGSGGAIATASGADLIISDSYFRLNVTDFSGGMGGAIYNGAGTILEMSRVEISANKSYDNSGGGIANFGSLNLTNVTLAENTSELPGAGIYTSAGTDVVYLRFTTVAYNLDQSVTDGDGIYVNSGNVDLEGTIIAWNGNDSGDGSNCYGLDGSFETHGYNFESGETCDLDIIEDDQVNTDPRLGTLGMYNSNNKTQSYNLLFDSPAIDFYDGGSCPSVDQRGFDRPQDGGLGLAVCDSGAYETNAPTVFLPLVIRP